MFRWLKDRSKKNRRLSASPTGSLLSKEDDYGFKQKLQPPPLPPQQQQQQQQLQSGEYKRDLPPTPADLMTSCNLTDDDKSLHIYEEIPDLPFRCTPEGELRIHLAKEAASRKDPQPSSAGAPSQSWASPRNISPYMVVPLERLSETPSEFRTSPHDASRFHRTSSQQDKAFACALVGLKRSEDGGVATTSPCCDSPQQSGSSPSCCGSSVFGSPWLCGGGGGGGDGAVDMSERLLTAINLTRLLAAVRLSSSSADTCATSPLCIGVDKDGRNISVSVTPTTTSTSTNHHHHHHPHHHHNHSGDGEDLEVTSPPHPPESCGSIANTDRGLEPPVLRSEPGSEAVQPDSSPLVAEGGVACPALGGGGGGVGGATGLAPDTSPDCAVVTREKTDRVKQKSNRVNQKTKCVKQQTKCASQQITDCVVHKDTNRVSQKTDCATTAEATTTTTAAIEAEETGDPRDYPRPATTSLRFLPSPSELSAITEILQLRPGEKTELDPATIDALLLRLCSHTLQADGAGRSEEGPPGGGGLHPQELEAVENMLKEMLKSGEEEAEREGRGPPSSSALPSPGTRRAENSDTGFEYDVSTSSESDQANYDYFLSKAAQTRSLECEVKKLIHHGGEEGEEEEGGEGASEAGESVTTVSTLSPTSLSSSIPLSLTPEGDPDSDDGTMADLSESENSSGYYESFQHATGGAGPKAADYSQGGKKKEKGGEEDKKKRTRERRKKKGEEESPSEVDLPCYELHGTEEVSSPYSALHSQPRELASVSRLSAYSHLVSTAAAQRGIPAEVSAPTTNSGRTAHHKSKGGGKRSRHHHHAHPHHPHREGRQRRGGGGSAKHSPPQDGGSPSRALRDIQNPRDSDPSGGQDAGRDNSTERVYSSKSRYGQPHPKSSWAGTTPKSLDRRRDGKKSSTTTTSTSSSSSKTRHPSDYPYYSLLYSQGTSSSRQRLKAPKTRLDLERSASFHSSHSQRDSSVYGQACRETSEVYSLPAALPDPRGGDRSLGGVPGAVGGGGSVGRQPVQEDSEVYGTRAGLQGGCHNRLLSDLIMLNYNRQVLNM